MIKLNKESLFIAGKGFCMGMADIVPGVSGGTVALITGVYDQLISSISSVNKEFLTHIIKFRIKAAAEHINLSFLLPLFMGILTAIISMASLMHFLMSNYGVYTWSLFFGLILASIVFIAKHIETIKDWKSFAYIAFGTCVGYFIVTLIPVETPNNTIFVFLSATIAICAMILPGISGSFILLILGKYIYVTSAIKAPFEGSNLMVIATFGSGCLVGLLSFSKLLNYLLKHYHNQLMCVLVGFMIGSMKKIWPWREVLEQKVVRGKTHVLKDAVIFPQSFGTEEIIAFGLMFFGIILVFAIESLTNKDSKK